MSDTTDTGWSTDDSAPAAPAPAASPAPADDAPVDTEAPAGEDAAAEAEQGTPGWSADETTPVPPPEVLEPDAPTSPAPPPALHEQFAPVLEQMHERTVKPLIDVISQQQAQFQNLVQQATEQRAAQNRQRAIEASRPVEPGPEASIAERIDHVRKMAQWENQQYVSSLEGKIEQFGLQMMEMAKAFQQQRDAAQFEAKRAEIAQQYNGAVSRLAGTREFAFLNTPDGRAFFDSAYRDAATAAGQLVDPLPIAQRMARMMRTSVGNGSVASERTAAVEKLKSDRQKQAGNKTSQFVARPARAGAGQHQESYEERRARLASKGLL